MAMTETESLEAIRNSLFANGYETKDDTPEEVWNAFFVFMCHWQETKTGELVDKLQNARGALADIATANDVTLDVARQKAQRIYDETADPTP